MGYRIGIDTGGTFTDLIAFESTGRRIVTAKRPSTASGGGRHAPRSSLRP